MRSAQLGSVAALVLGFTIAIAPTTASAAAITVSPGESIQDAVDAAAPGSTIFVLPGDYVETHGDFVAVRITKRLKLIAKSKLPDLKVRILPGPGQTDGILIEAENPGVGPDVERVTVQGFTVEGFSRNGIWTRYADRFKIIGNETINAGHVGIFPTLSANGLVKKNLAYGALDAALWVEAAENVRVIRNEFHTSPTGLEITVSKKVQAKKNHVHHNTVGVGLYHPNGASLPQLGDDGDWDIIGNFVHDNNFPNPVTGGLVGVLPQGIGVLLLGVDRVDMKKNQIVANDLIGVTIVDYCLILALAAPEIGCGVNPPVADPSPDDNRLIRNEITGNGLDPLGDFAAFAGDLLIVGGTNNCGIKNEIGTISGSPLPPC